jgi:hypothetical protein
MPELKKFEPEKVNAALKLLRSLPGKDNRKSLNEALAMLSGGIQAAIEKGYSRRAIRNMLAEAGVVISTTSLNNFLNGEQKNSSQPKATPVKREMENRKTATEQQVNTKSMDDEQKKALPENSNRLPEDQEL